MRIDFGTGLELWGISIGVKGENIIQKNWRNRNRIKINIMKWKFIHLGTTVIISAVSLEQCSEKREEKYKGVLGNCRITICH